MKLFKQQRTVESQMLLLHDNLFIAEADGNTGECDNCAFECDSNTCRDVCDATDSLCYSKNIVWIKATVI